MVEALTYDNPDHKIKLKKFDNSKQWLKVQGKLITLAMNDTLVANQCSHQVLQIE